MSILTRPRYSIVFNFLPTFLPSKHLRTMLFYPWFCYLFIKILIMAWTNFIVTKCCFVLNFCINSETIFIKKEIEIFIRWFDCWSSSWHAFSTFLFHIGNIISPWPRTTIRLSFILFIRGSKSIKLNAKKLITNVEKLVFLKSIQSPWYFAFTFRLFENGFPRVVAALLFTFLFYFYFFFFFDFFFGVVSKFSSF